MFGGSVVFEPAVEEAFPLEWWTQQSPAALADLTGVGLGSGRRWPWQELFTSFNRF